MIHLGRYEEIKDLRSVWPDEAHDFTPWLAQPENMEILSETLGIDLTPGDTEVSVGRFRADIIAYETDTNRKVLIENQLMDSNHEHLGKLLTYASHEKATYVVWIVRRALDEHKAAMEWLNNHTDDSVGFFLLEIKLIKIGSSDIAPMFEIVEKPNNWVRRRTENRDPINRTKLPKIKDMIEWGVVDPGDIIQASDNEATAVLQADGLVQIDTGEVMSMQQWLKGVYGWSAVETYKFAIHQKSGKTLSEIRREYMEQE